MKIKIFLHPFRLGLKEFQYGIVIGFRHKWHCLGKKMN